MDKFLELIVEFAKDNGVGVTIPVAIWIVVKAMIEDYKDKKEATEKNHADIEALEKELASLKATVAALETVVY